MASPHQSSAIFTERRIHMFLLPARLLAGLGATVTTVAFTGLLGSPASAVATGSTRVSGTTVSFAAAAGAVNSVVVTLSGRTVTIDDRVAVKAGRGCRAVARDTTKVQCTTAK